MLGRRRKGEKCGFMWRLGGEFAACCDLRWRGLLGWAFVYLDGLAGK